MTRGVLALLVIGGSGLAIADSAMVRHQLALSFIRQPDDFVELFFPSPDRLPSSFVPGRPFTASFALTDVSSDSHRYAYLVSVTLRSGKSIVERSGSVTLAPHETRKVPLRLVLRANATALTIRLAGRPELIRLHLTRTRR